MMDLEEFIKQTLTQIIRGVEGAQEALADGEARVSPRMAPTNFDGKDRIIGQMAEPGSGEYPRPVMLVDFDVAVGVKEGEETKGGIGVVTGFFKLGAQGKSGNETTQANRIQFSVPIALPANSAKIPKTTIRRGGDPRF